MIIRRLDENDDWSYGYNESDYLKERYAVGLNVLTKLREWKNNCFFNADAGIDYPTRLGSFNQKNALDNDIQTIILNCEDVIDISEFNSNFDRKTRVYNFEAQVITLYSDEAISIKYSTEDVI